MIESKQQTQTFRGCKWLLVCKHTLSNSQVRRQRPVKPDMAPSTASAGPGSFRHGP